MLCPKCQGKETRTVSEIDDGGDLKLTICADETCGYVLSKVRVIERPDGSKVERKQRIKPEEQPEGIGAAVEIEEPIMSAQEMMQLAIKTREETVGKQAREVVREIIAECAQPEIILTGNHEYTISEENLEKLPTEVLDLIVKDLRARGYKPSKKPVPGEGVKISVKWPTKKKKIRKRKTKTPQKKTEQQEPKKQTADQKTAKEQRAAAKHRRDAMKKRSKLPT